MAMTDIDIAAIRERLEKATPGPWRHIVTDGRQNQRVESEPNAAQIVGPENSDRALLTLWVWKPEGRRDARPNADFIANAPTDIAALLARVEEMEAKLSDYEQKFERQGQRYRTLKAHAEAMAAALEQSTSSLTLCADLHSDKVEIDRAEKREAAHDAYRSEYPKEEGDA